jgi:C-terminal processing protease CtpA/Prc
MLPDGGRFEGVGIRPDVEVSPTVEDLRAGGDVELEAARARLLSPAERASEGRQSHTRSEFGRQARGGRTRLRPIVCESLPSERTARDGLS